MAGAALAVVGSPPLRAQSAADTLAAHDPADTIATPGLADTLAAHDLAEDLRSFGPLRVAERNPLYHLFLTPTVEGSEVLPGGAWKVRVASAYSNIFEYNFSDAFEQRFDLERSSTLLSLSRGLGAGLEVGASVGFQHNWGGFLDPAIQGIHDLFGLPNADREKVDNGQFGVYLGTRLGPQMVFLDLSPGTAIEAPRLWMAWRIAGGPESAGDITVRGTVKLPLGDFGASSRSTDVAGEVAARRSWGATHLHLSMGVVRFDPPEILAQIMRDGAWFGSVALERRVSPGLSLVGQFFGGSRYAAGFGIRELDNLPLNLSVGGRGRFGSDWTWQVSFTEDVPPNSPSVDFTLDVTLARVWAPG